MTSLAARIAPPFPLAGSMAWLRPEPGRPDPQPVRIVQHDRRDGSVRVSAAGKVYPGEVATAVRRVTLAELAETEEAAMRKPARARKTRRTK